MNFRRKQWMVATSAALAMLVVFLVGAYAQQLFSGVSLPSDDIPGRLGFAARWLLLPGLALLAGIQGAARRGFMADAIDGTRMPRSHSLEINLRYNTNTTEQLLLLVVAWPGLALLLPADRLVLIPAVATLFVVGRALFWIGYAIHPLARGFGMTMTAVPTLVAYVWLIARWVDANH